jgi:predicted ATPase
MLAEMHGLAGQVDAGLSVVAEGLQAANETGERLMEADLYRLRAGLLRKQGRDAQAEADLSRSIGIARSQQAKLWELRAALDLARLWRDRGRVAPARQLLTDVYGWFTEGFDTHDLQAAKTLLEELGSI